MNTGTCSICGTENLIVNYICTNCGFDQDDTQAWIDQIEKDND